jgi:hypothetical protein
VKRKSPPVEHTQDLADVGRMPAERSAITFSAMRGLEDRETLSLAPFVPWFPATVCKRIEREIFR